VVHYNSKRLVSGSVRYRTIQNVRDIENMTHFSVTPQDASKAYDVREPHFNSEETNDIDFRKSYQHIEMQETLSELETRYQEVLQGYGERMLEFENSLNNVDTTASQNAYNEFLGATEPTPRSRRGAPNSVDVAVDAGEILIDGRAESGGIANVPSTGWGVYEEAAKELAENNAKIGKEPETQDNSEPEIVLRNKKRLENIE
jgi:hypothetical protein